MAGFALNLSGLDNLTKRLTSLESNLRIEVAAEMSASALRIETKAKRNAPVNLGTLRQSIHSVSDTGGLTHRVIASASYAPYVEFGTGGSVKVDPQYANYALQFKGKRAGGGTLDEFLLALMDWVKRKGIAGTYQAKTYDIKTRKASKITRKGGKSQQMSEDFDVAFAIMLKILKKGINPQPFLLPPEVYLR